MPRRLKTTEVGKTNRLNRGHRLKGNGLWEDPIQATVEQWWRCHGNDMRRAATHWKELEKSFIAHLLR